MEPHVRVTMIDILIFIIFHHFTPNRSLSPHSSVSKFPMIIASEASHGRHLIELIIYAEQ